jgi:hypothetical protein
MFASYFTRDCDMISLTTTVIQNNFSQCISLALLTFIHDSMDASVFSYMTLPLHHELVCQTKYMT